MSSLQQQGELFALGTQIGITRHPDQAPTRAPTQATTQATTNTTNIKAVCDANTSAVARGIEKPPLWLCIQLPWLILEAAWETAMKTAMETANQEASSIDATTTPVCVYEKQGNQELVKSCNRLARYHGVTPAMVLSHAYALSPRLKAIPRSRNNENKRLKKAAKVAYRISSQVGIYQGAILLELGRSLRWFESNRLLRQLRLDLEQIGMVARIGIAPSATAAQLFARRQLHAFDSQQTRTLLRHWPIRDLPFLASQKQAMLGCGLKQVGDLWRLENRSIQRRFGADILAYLDSIEHPTLPNWKAYFPVKIFSRRFALPSPTNQAQAVEEVAKLLLGQLHKFLLNQNKVLRAAHFLLHLEKPASRQKNHPIRIDLGLRRATSELTYLSLLLSEKLDRLKVDQSVIEIELNSDQLINANSDQAGLFDSSQATDVAIWLDQLTARLGTANIQRLAPLADHRPEYSWQWLPAGQPCKKSITDQRLRPIWLLEDAKSLSPEQSQRLDFLTGPERIESGWWDGRDCRRDYFIACDKKGRRLWIYRDIRAKAKEIGRQWLIHGWFG